MWRFHPRFTLEPLAADLSCLLLNLSMSSKVGAARGVRLDTGSTSRFMRDVPQESSDCTTTETRPGHAHLRDCLPSNVTSRSAANCPQPSASRASMPITHAMHRFVTITALLLLASGVVARAKDTQLSVITFINRCQLPISIHENGIQVCKIKAGSKTNATGGCSRLVTSNNSMVVYRTDSQEGTSTYRVYDSKLLLISDAGSMTFRGENLVSGQADLVRT